MAELSLVEQTGNVVGKGKVFLFFTRVAAGFLFLFLLSAAGVESAGMEFLGPCLPPGTGDWVVSSPATCQDMAIVMNGNVTVTSALEIINVTLVFNSTSPEGLFLEAKSESILRIYNSSLTSSSPDAHFSVLVRDNVDFSLVDSLVDGAGAKDPELFANETPATNNARYIEYGRFLWGQGVWNLPLWTDDGIQIQSTVTEFRNNTFTNFTAIWVYSDNNLIEGNSFIGMKHHGLGFMEGSDGNRVIGNYFGHAARMNRQIDGIKFFPGTSNEEIAYNTIEWVPEAMSIVEIPPYTGGNNFQFHHNRVQHVIHAAIIDADNVQFSYENYSEIYAMGISISSYYNITVQNSTFKNLSFQEELKDIINVAYYNECVARDLIPSMAYWMYLFYTSKAFIKATSYGNLLEVKNSYFGYGPPYTAAIIFDGATHNNFRAYNNTFEMIGNYIPSGFTARQDMTGRVPLAGNSALPGAAISLEAIKKANIEGNVFRNVVHGILTSTPDSLGTYGDYTIRNNAFEGIGNFTWEEELFWGFWWYGDRNVTEKGIGVGLGTHGWITSGGYPWGCVDIPVDHWMYLTYISEVSHSIKNNTFKNFYYPIVIDYSRAGNCEINVLGPKHALIYNNSFFNYTTFMLMNGSPSTIEFADNRDICEDMTAYGQCSVNQPLFCQNGVLVENCSVCGCPSGYTCELNGTCSADFTIPVCGPYDDDGNGRIETSELFVAIGDWFQGRISIQDIVRYAADFRNGMCTLP